MGAVVAQRRNTTAADASSSSSRKGRAVQSSPELIEMADPPGLAGAEMPHIRIHHRALIPVGRTHHAA
jgi:hypothetical protein